MADILPEDAGVIRCICGFDHDDNFTIQCERCNAWQHATCVNIKDESAVPDNYLCPDCSHTQDQIDRTRAKEHQRKFLQQKADSQKQTRFQVDSETQDDERRRRGSRKRSMTEVVSKPSPDPIPQFDHKFFVVPAAELDWSAQAAKVWEELEKSSNLPRVSPKEYKSMPGLQVHRANTEHWRLGVRAGAVTPVSNVGSNRLVCEIFGEVLLRSEYSQEPTNQFLRLGCPKPGVVFVPGLPFAVDMRRHGSREALFLNRSTTPNVRLVAAKDSHNKLRIFVYTRKPVKAGVELSLGWHWPANHPIREAIAQTNADKNSVDARNSLEFVKTALWLLEEPDLQSCTPVNNSDELDEDWEVTETRPPPPPRRARRAEELAHDAVPIAKSEADPGVAMAMHVWVPAPLSAAPPPKKRMSLKDYIRKRH